MTPTEITAAKAEGMAVVVATQTNSKRQFILVSGLQIVGYADSRDAAHRLASSISRRAATTGPVVVVDRIRNRVLRVR